MDSVVKPSLVANEGGWRKRMWFPSRINTEEIKMGGSWRGVSCWNRRAGGEKGRGE